MCVFQEHSATEAEDQIKKRRRKKKKEIRNKSNTRGGNNGFHHFRNIELVTYKQTARKLKHMEIAS